MLGSLAGKNVLLLQGPAGPFFRRLARELEGLGARTLRVTFNAGDSLFHLGLASVPFRQPMDQWPEFMAKLVEDESIDVVVMYGDMRPIHVAARQLCTQRGLPVYVFEEGYLRPDYITLELGGVNGNSSIPNSPDVFRSGVEGQDSAATDKPAAVGHTFTPSALWSTAHSMAATILYFLYPHYVHHRLYNCWQHTFYWPRGGIRKLWYRARERGILDRLSNGMSAKYFFVPLQVHCDAQLQHSDFSSVEDFARHVVKSFAGNAPGDLSLVFKHHPADRAYTNYDALFRLLAEEYGLGDRLIYVHDLHLPTMLKHALGTVVINSTVGLSSLHHRTPVLVLGDAVYDVTGLSAGGSLDEFWTDPGVVDAELFTAFRDWLLKHNQINGSVWKRVHAARGATGIHWGQVMIPTTAPSAEPTDQRFAVAACGGQDDVDDALAPAWGKGPKRIAGAGIDGASA